ncbi:hypothetical protein AB0L40_02435 [Patulibacter sp. NPDC049589]|uniref:hypothetical protein n=1 Tax=Patulibacter sp. NPDC049589 TaxID=3154731 RepID=UPI00342722D2
MPPQDLVVIGGSGLLALNLISRATRDVDVLAAVLDGSMVTVDPLPPPLRRARDTVARDSGLSSEWLNTGPAGLLRFGLPEGFEDRPETRRFGSSLTVRFASRFDQIHFKLYATVDDGGPGKHERDLVAVGPMAGAPSPLVPPSSRQTGEQRHQVALATVPSTELPDPGPVRGLSTGAGLALVEQDPDERVAVARRSPA